MSDSGQILLALASVLVAAYLAYWRLHPLYSIPTVGGPSAPLFSYIGAWRFRHHAKEMIDEGYQKHKVFKVATFERWILVLAGSEMNGELCRLPDSHVSANEAANEALHITYTLAPDIGENPFHIGVIRGALTRNLNVIFPDMIDEVKVASSDILPQEKDGWVGVSVLSMMGEIISRTSSRVFVGLPLCRDKGYLQMILTHVWNLTKANDFLRLVPSFLIPIVGPMLPYVKRTMRATSAYLVPIIEERIHKLKELGDEWTDKPNDLLMWLIEEAVHQELSTSLIVQAVVMSEFAAIDTSSQSITHALYHLAANTEYVQPLREEIEATVKEHGWTKAAMGKMWKLDSLMRESQRVNGLVALSVPRVFLEDVVLSDGIRIPAGTFACAAATAVHTDKGHYDNPEVFDPFRFSSMRMKENESNKHQFTSTSLTYIAFGFGKHACPGRFFAANEIKVMLAFIILNYDMKFENGGGRPENVCVSGVTRPSEVKVLFKKRRAIVDEMDF